MDLQNIIITAIDKTQTISRVKGKDNQICNRPNHGISFCISGQITYYHKGKEFVSTPNTAVYLPMGATYESKTDKTGLFPLINFHCQVPLSDTIMVIPLRSPEPYLAEFDQLTKSLLLPHGKLRSMELFYSILAKLSAETHAKQTTLAPVVRYLEANIHDRTLSNATLAARLCYSEVYFRKLFTSVYGCTPHRYIMNLRIRRAKQLLADGILSVTAIAEQCGFSSVYHLSRAFKQTVGISPSEYSQNNRQSNI